MFITSDCCWIFQENTTPHSEDDEDKEENQGRLVKSVLQAKLQRLAILIGYFGMSLY